MMSGGANNQASNNHGNGQASMPNMQAISQGVVSGSSGNMRGVHDQNAESMGGFQ